MALPVIEGVLFSTYSTQQGLPSDDAPAVTGDDTGRIWALSQGSIVEWDEAGSRFMDLPPERLRYSYSPNGRFGFWSLDGDTVHLFVRGQGTQLSPSSRVATAQS